MSRFSRINTIWRKELIDTLRDRRTLAAMVLVPMVLYPALMLGSIQAFEVQVSYLVTEEYAVGVASEEVRAWLQRMIDTDPARRSEAPGATAEEILEAAEQTTAPDLRERGAPAAGRGSTETARSGVYNVPPPYRIFVVDEIGRSVLMNEVQAAVLVDGPPPLLHSDGSTRVLVAFDESDIRSEIAATGIKGILDRANETMLQQRLGRHDLDIEFIQPIAAVQENIAPAERMAGAVLGKIVPLILIVMTITGAIYPAIDLTAGERERGTLETLMVAPVPTVDLVAGKFVVVTLIGLMSATLNLISIGGTIYLGGVGSILTGGAGMAFPLAALPWIFVLLVPLAVLFSAMLLAVCSFARSFKEAQNYITPVMMAALIPGVVGILPGTRLEGPILIMPVANIVVLTRDLFLSKFDYNAILIVTLTTSLYAGAAVAVAAKLFGQEAVLFADSGSIKTIFQRRFFKPRPTPSAASALLVLALVFTLNFYLQQALAKAGWSEGLPFLIATAVLFLIMMGVGPAFAAVYARVDVRQTFRLKAPNARALIAALCFGSSTWVLAKAWFVLQARFLPMDPRAEALLQAQFGWMDQTNPLVLVAFLALIPAVLEEFFYRGYVLSGVRSNLGKLASLLVVSLAFSLTHYSAHRIAMTFFLGALLGLLVIQYGSVLPAMLAHFMHNALTLITQHPQGIGASLEAVGIVEANGDPTPACLIGALVIVAIGVLLCLIRPQRQGDAPDDLRPADALVSSRGVAS